MYVSVCVYGFAGKYIHVYHVCVGQGVDRKRGACVVFERMRLYG